MEKDLLPKKHTAGETQPAFQYLDEEYEKLTVIVVQPRLEVCSNSMVTEYKAEYREVERV